MTIRPSPRGYAIERACALTPDLQPAMAQLVPLLSPRRKAPDAGQLQAILDDGRIHLLLARDAEGAVVGSVTLVLYRVPTGLRARIEDLVVAPSHQGHGLGRALMEGAMQAARAAHAHVLDLTSNPSRVEANRLYMALGFRRWETNVFRKELDEPWEGTVS